MLIPLNSPAAQQASLCGTKASKLAQLMSAGFLVPEGFVVPTAAWSALMAHLQLLPYLEEVSAHPSALRPDLGWPKIEEVQNKIAAATLPAEWIEEIGHAVDHIAQKYPYPVDWAIRSSALAEDLAEASFAGQYETFLGAQGVEEVVEGIKRCWASFLNPRSRLYLSGRGMSSLGGAVLVQRLIHASAAGVAFTEDPLGNRKNSVVINANFGLGQAVVSGQVDPDTFVVAKDTHQIVQVAISEKKSYALIDRHRCLLQPLEEGRQKAPALTEDEVRAVAQLAGLVEKAEQHPVDMEWALYEGQLYLLQARPISTPQSPPAAIAADWAPALNTPINPSFPLYSSGNISEVIPGCITPLSWSYIGPRLERAFRDLPERLGVMPQLGPNHIVIGFFYHRLYLNVSYFLELARRFPGAKAETVWEELVGAAASLDKKTEAPEKESFWNRLLIFWRACLLEMSVTRDLRQLEADYRQKQAQALTAGFGIDSIRPFTAEEAWPAIMHIRISQWAQSTLALLYQLTARWLKDPQKVLAKTLVAGAETCSSAPAFILYRLAQQVKSDSALQALFDREQNNQRLYSELNQSSHTSYQLFRTQFAYFLERYGHRGVCEGELRHVTWREDPGQVVGLVRHLMTAELPSPEQLLQQQKKNSQQALEEALSQLSWYQRLILRSTVRRAKDFMAKREQTKDLIMLFCDLERKKMRVACSYGVAQGWWEHADDLYFLLKDELVELIKGTANPATLIPLIQQRKREFMVSQSVSVPKIQEGKARFFFKEALDLSSDSFKGVGLSVGQIEGWARVLKNVQENDQLLLGEILVVPNVDIAWTPLFLKAAGLVIEVGGVLSHGAIVAREYGIPAVGAISDATDLIQTGDYLHIDGSQGMVKILKRRACL